MQYRTSLGICLVAGLFIFQLAIAQDASLPNGNTGAGEARANRVNLNFPGGSVVAYVDQIRQVMPEANFVLAPGAESFQMPAMQLRNVGPEHLAMLISEVSAPPMPGAQIRSTTIDHVYAVQVFFPTHSPDRRQTEPMVISLEEVLTDKLQAEDILTSVETALELFGEAYPQASLRYHDATKLLIARGHEHQIAHVITVIDQLRRARHVRESLEQLEVVTQQTRQLQEMLSEREVQIHQLQRHADMLRVKADQLERELADCRDRLPR